MAKKLDIKRMLESLYRQLSDSDEPVFIDIAFKIRVAAGAQGFDFNKKGEIEEIKKTSDWEVEEWSKEDEIIIKTKEDGV